MIQIDRKKLAIPDALNGPGSKGARERARAEVFYKLKKNAKKQFKFAAYKLPGIAETLELLCSGKCAYCESSYQNVEPVDIEHYRPKGGVEIDGVLHQPAYYWLAADWGNLFPSCIDCNRARTQMFDDIGPEVAGKANKFPIASESKRATRPGEETQETPLLLNPCNDDPADHVEFDDEGMVRHVARSRKGKVSIEILALRRPGLIHARKEVAIDIVACIKRLKWLRRQKRRYPRDKSFLARIEDEETRLEKYAAPKSEFAGMARQIIERHLPNG